MATEIKMPQLGESVVEGTITRWLKQEGDSVSEDELLVEVSTDKVDSEVPSSAAGVIQKILVPEGETVKVGTPIAVIGAPGEAPGERPAAAEQPSAAPTDVGDAAEQAAADRHGVEEGARAGDEASVPARPAQAPAAQADGPTTEPRPAAEPASRPRAEEPSGEAAEEPEPAGDGDLSKRGIISPLVRRLADEHGVDLGKIEGTGTGGRIRKQDVLRHVSDRGAPAAAAEAAPAETAPAEAAPPAHAPAERQAPEPRAVPAEREELVAWTNIRRRTAEHMVASAREVARAWNAVEVDWTNVVTLRARVKDAFGAREGFGLTYMPFLGRVVCDTLLDMPEVNATFDEENQANRLKHYVNLGVAVALEGGGLIVPVVKGADERNLVGLARGINDVVTRARSRKLSPDDIAGGTFSITNPGPFGSILSVPIIPRGQTAILAFEAIEKRVVVRDDAIAIRSMGFLSLSWDHRVIDGAEAARFLARLKQRIETTDFAPELSQYL